MENILNTKMQCVVFLFRYFNRQKVVFNKKNPTANNRTYF